MSVQLAELHAREKDVEPVDVSARSYDSDTLFLEQGRDLVQLDLKQLQELSVVIERFLDR